MKTYTRLKRKFMNGCAFVLPHILFIVAAYLGVKLGLGPKEGLCLIEGGEWTRCIQFIKP